MLKRSQSVVSTHLELGSNPRFPDEKSLYRLSYRAPKTSLNLSSVITLEEEIIFVSFLVAQSDFLSFFLSFFFFFFFVLFISHQNNEDNILTPTQPVGGGRMERGSKPRPSYKESRALPAVLPQSQRRPNCL